MRTKGQIQGWQDLTSQLNQLEFAMYSGDESMMRAKLHQIVPEYIYREQNKTIAELYEYPKARAAQAD
jgi:hypothetical protein